MDKKEIIKTLNEKVKAVDERFKVSREDYLKLWEEDITQITVLYFDNERLCYIDPSSDEMETYSGSADVEIFFKRVVGDDLTEKERLILKGAKAFYEGYHEQSQSREYCAFCDPYRSRVIKYRICLHKEFCGSSGDVYIIFNPETSSYSLNPEDEIEGCQTEFTTEEIADMPLSIRKAINWGFLDEEEIIYEQ